jgi:hypothetical protein
VRGRKKEQKGKKKETKDYRELARKHISAL